MTPAHHILTPETPEAIQRCFPLMLQLRPHLLEKEFVPRIQRQRQEGYVLACLQTHGAVKCLAGYRILENLAWGRFMYVDDLVTDTTEHRKGWGGLMFAWLRQTAISQGCAELHLDSGVQRFPAHRFYLGERMDITCHHFALTLAAKS